MKWVVLVISFILAGALYAHLKSGLCFCGSQKETAQLFVTKTLTASFQQFYTATGRYPTTEEGLNALIYAPKGTEDRWRGPYIDGDKIPQDPWGHSYRYHFSTRDNTYRVWSRGPDGFTSEDDIGSSPPLKS